MRRRSSYLLSDGALLLLFVLCFVSVLFTAGDPNRYVENIIFLNGAFLLAIVTYFTTVTTGLILNILFIFGFGTYTLYQAVVEGEAVGAQSYFWLIMTPAFTVVVWMLTLATKRLQADNERLQRANSRLATLDESTSLRNSLSFQKDASVFMAISERYNIPLTLLVMNVKYWDELKRIVSEDEMSEAVLELSKLSETSLRTNDSLYMLNKDNPTWGVLLFTDREGARVVVERLKQKIVELGASEFEGKFKVELNLRIGVLEYRPDEIPTPLDFIVKARQQLEYDV
ncbi:GGDEF domain-containing protein [Paenibacillus sp. GCM10023252]|uniref:GGDEF domain-containing protein n=1 Tax=Paenibacillus sp. GCM10023252 TaxID=3252649 RepID=UPI0036174636